MKSKEVNIYYMLHVLKTSTSLKTFRHFSTYWTIGANSNHFLERTTYFQLSLFEQETPTKQLLYSLIELVVSLHFGIAL